MRDSPRSASVPSPHLELRTRSDPAELAPVRKSIEQFAAGHGFDEKAAAEIGLVINEAMANIIRHAYGGRTDRPMHLWADADSRRLVITLRDWGNGINPSRVARSERDPLKPGGVGMVCLRQWMDEVTFTPQPDGMLTTLIRNR